MTTKQLDEFEREKILDYVKGNEYDSTIPPIVVGTYKVAIIGRGNYVDSTDNKDFEIIDTNYKKLKELIIISK